MPAEWEPHHATCMTWPAREDTSFPGAGHHDAVLPVFVEMIRALVQSEFVLLNGCQGEDLDYVRQALSQPEISRVCVTGIPAVYPWCRDHGPTFLVSQDGAHLGAVNWDYNAWGGKYPEILPKDFQINRRMAALLGARSFLPGVVMEGGSIEVNGAGAVLTTTQCLLNSNRNPHLRREQIEEVLREFLDVSTVLWLEEGIVGDDTDGHIDDITRFVNADTVLTVVEPDTTDANHEPLRRNLELLKKMKTASGSRLNILELPMPAPVVIEDCRLPASYANFYIANGIILQPVFGDQHDDKAVETVGKCFPGRQMVPINCRELVWGLGTFHCLTQQLPEWRHREWLMPAVGK
ncbi:MAG: agmatine deiminase family protein [Verrucomicrobiales bacterium]|nr:agmatine deiminase family protein [Verrucomicrobiales bacterium]